MSQDKNYTLKEWAQIYEDLFKTLEQVEECQLETVFSKLCEALKTEESQRCHESDFLASIEARLDCIFQAVITQTAVKPQTFELFCYQMRFISQRSPYQDLTLRWLHHLSLQDNLIYPNQDAILAAQIYLGAYDSSWEKVGSTLLDFLDHRNDEVRAGAAYQIGNFCRRAFSQHKDIWEWDWDEHQYHLKRQSVVGILPLETLFQIIRDKEIERPGIAGAFLQAAPTEKIDVKEWILDILNRSSTPEPYSLYFPCNLAFDAHERFSQDSDAISRLMEMGRSDIAVLAATDEKYPNPALKPLLIQLGNSEDHTISRIASWHLAYHYHYLHSVGAAQKYVELITLQEVHLFLLFSRKQEQEPPYAAVIYPSDTDSMELDLAQTWVDKVFPEHHRGEPRNDDLLELDSHWYQRGYVQYFCSNSQLDSTQVDHVIIGYRANLPWNPKDYL